MFLNNSIIDNNFIFTFISRILDHERTALYNLPKEKKDYSKYLSVVEHTDDKIIVTANFNYGLAPYNIFTFTDFSVSSLNATAYEDYSKIWQDVLTNTIDGYKKALDDYKDSKFELNFIP